MRGYSKVVLLGNLTKDAELRYLPSGTPVVNFTVAVNRTYRLASGDVKEETSFIPVELLGKAAENFKNSLVKGKAVFVEGRLRQRRWETSDGQRRSSLDVVAFDIRLLGQPPKVTEEEKIGLEEYDKEKDLNLFEEDNQEIPF